MSSQRRIIECPAASDLLFDDIEVGHLRPNSSDRLAEKTSPMRPTVNNDTLPLLNVQIATVANAEYNDPQEDSTSQIQIAFAHPNNTQTLCMAAANGDIEIVRSMLKSGADVDVRDAPNSSLTALAYAAASGHLTVVRDLLAHGADVNAKDDVGRTALSECGLFGHNDIVRELLKAGADVDATDIHGRTLLMEAAGLGNFELCLLLLTYGADANAVSLCSKTSSFPLLEAVKSGRLQVASVLLGTGRIQPTENLHATPSRVIADPNLKNRSGRSALLEACRLGYMDIVKFLIERGAKTNADAEDSRGRTPLAEAAKFGHLDVVRILLESSCCSYLSVDERERTALMDAVLSGHSNVVTTLIESVEDSAVLKEFVNAEDEDGATALIFASSCSFPRQESCSKALRCLHSRDIMLESLLNSGADVNHTDLLGQTALIRAAAVGYPTVVRRLLESGACDIDMEDDTGRTALSHVAQTLRLRRKTSRSRSRAGGSPRSHSHVYQYPSRKSKSREEQSLLYLKGNNHAIASDRKGSHHGLALERRSKTSCIEGQAVAGGLNGKHKPVSPRRVKSSGYNRATGLRGTRRRRLDSNHSEKTDAYPAISMRSENARSRGRMNSRSRMESASIEIAKLLLLSGAFVDHKDNHGRSPLMLACLAKNIDMVELLLDHGANANTLDDAGRSPLYEACVSGNVKLVDCLLGRGANISSCNRQAKMVITAAIASGKREILKAIEKYGDLQAINPVSLSIVRKALAETMKDGSCSKEEEMPALHQRNKGSKSIRRLLRARKLASDKEPPSNLRKYAMLVLGFCTKYLEVVSNARG